MSKILISRLWLTTRHDGSQVIAGKFGYDGKIRIETNPDKQTESDPDFLAFIDYQQPKAAPSLYRAPAVQAPRPMATARPRSAPALPLADPFADHYVDGEIVE